MSLLILLMGPIRYRFPYLIPDQLSVWNKVGLFSAVIPVCITLCFSQTLNTRSQQLVSRSLFPIHAHNHIWRLFQYSVICSSLTCTVGQLGVNSKASIIHRVLFVSVICHCPAVYSNHGQSRRLSVGRFPLCSIHM